MSSRPEWRLKVVIQANALVDALLAAVCMAARNHVADFFNLPSFTISILVGFILAFSSAFMFRITVKDIVPRRYAIVGAAGNIFTAVVMSLLVIFDPLSLSRKASIVSVVVAAVHAVFGITLTALLHSSVQGYVQTDVMVV